MASAGMTLCRVVGLRGKCSFPGARHSTPGERVGLGFAFGWLRVVAFVQGGFGFGCRLI